MRRGVGILLASLLIPAFIATQGRAGAPAFSRAYVRVGSPGYEPGIDISPAGTVFVNAPVGLGGHSRLWRSTNGGSNFSEVQFGLPGSRLPGGGDSDVAVGPGGRVYFLDLWGGSNSLSRSDNDGLTWSTGTPLTTLPLSDRQWIAVGGPGAMPGTDTVYALYALIQPPSSVMLAVSRDSGLTWTEHLPAPGILGSSGFTGSLVADGRFLAFSHEDNGRMYVSTSGDGGYNWTQRQVYPFVSVISGIQGIALDGNDLHAVLIDRIDWSVNVVTSHDRGATWEAPVKVASGGSAIFPWIDARNGKVAVAWYGTDAPQPTQPDSVPGDSQWTVRYAESLDGGRGYSAPIAATPTVKNGRICTLGLACDADRDLGDFLQVVIDPSTGLSMIAYGDAVNGNVTRLARQIA